MHIRKRGQSWQVLVWVNGKQIGRTFKDRKTATVWAKGTELNAERGNIGLPQGVIPSSPCAGVALPRFSRVREVRMFTDEEIDKILAACTTPRLSAMVQVALGTGLRLAELMACKWPWFDLLREVVHVPASIEAGFIPKGKKERDIPLFPDVIQALKGWRSHTTREGRLFTGVNWRRWASAIRKRSGVRFRWHLCRHTYLSKLVMAGVPLRAVQEIAGHASIKTTEIYSHLAPDAFDEVRAKMKNRILGGMEATSGKIISLNRAKNALSR
jgi:integrase